MFQPVSLFVGLRYSRAAKGNAFISFISFFSIAGIALGLMSLITVSSVMNGFEQTLKAAMLDLIPHVQIKESEQLDQTKLKAIEDHPLVKQVSPYITSDVILQTNQDLVGVQLQGLFEGYESVLDDAIRGGSLTRLHKHKYQIALSRYLANKLGVSIGQQIRIIMPEYTTYTPLGRTPTQRLFTVAAIYDGQSEADTYLAFADGKSLQRLMRKKPEQYDLNIQLFDAFNLPDFYQQAGHLLQGFDTQDWQTQQGTLFAAVAMEKRIMSLLLGLIVIVAVFNIISALSMMVSEKQGEVAILQTLGFTPQMIAKVFMAQGMYNGIFGTILGIFGGLLLSNYINEALHLAGLQLLGGAELPVKIEQTELMIMAMGSILLSFLATLYPAKRASSVLPAEVLRYE
ncbi:lipoprotein-releasing ABC transporter permease subunit [Pseudoalteromonas sp. McH1-7]|uniref:lipoprotein-releasing ABC transporter permease subunit n=1 Tax=Pseudoalteromonas sp. McH1-7 TaxID=2745574 RepID=UPI001591A88F|nr:lipoprotein-releasing ABC transporter permease subunit [Pseudoalteromonas sp. McH1-7]NUZ09167.1 lipoprotein-releasing ABC transporter permease subunit [Pseudoalteromonas sp. McH1-7]